MKFQALNEAFNNKYGLVEDLVDENPAPINIKHILSVKDSSSESGEDYDHIDVVFAINDEDAARKLENAISDYFNKTNSLEGNNIWTLDDWEDYVPRPEIFANSDVWVDYDHGESASYSDIAIDKIDWGDDFIDDENVINKLLTTAWGCSEAQLDADIQDLVRQEEIAMKRNTSESLRESANICEWKLVNSNSDSNSCTLRYSLDKTALQYQKMIEDLLALYNEDETPKDQCSLEDVPNGCELEVEGRLAQSEYDDNDHEFTGLYLPDILEEPLVAIQHTKHSIARNVETFLEAHGFNINEIEDQVYDDMYTMEQEYKDSISDAAYDKAVWKHMVN